MDPWLVDEYDRDDRYNFDYPPETDRLIRASDHPLAQRTKMISRIVQPALTHKNKHCSCRMGNIHR